VVFRDLAEGLAERIAVTVLTSGCRGLAERECAGNLEIVRAPVLMRNTNAVASLPSMLTFFPSSMRTGRRLLGSRKYDLVHTSFAVPSGPSGLLLARRLRVPHVLSIHGGDIYDPSRRLSPHRTPFLKQMVHWVIHGSDRVVASSSDILHRAKAIYGDREIDRIPLAVRPVRFERLARAALGLGLEEDHVVLVTVGRLVARKGLDELIDIVAGVDEPRLRLVIVGEGPLREPLEVRARKAGVADRVCFAGFVSEERKWQVLEASDVYVSTTLHEGFGIVFLEAMEIGLPVVCYDCGGQTDFLKEEFSDLIPAGDKNRFRQRLVQLCKEGELRRRMGEVARHAVKDFYVERYVERYTEVYRECLAQRRSSG
jgi:glycosyltransferase involved in cell wall biosynthesis